MSNQPPLISIVIPCFNHGKYIADALQSIANTQIQYSYEIIIVDDGSTDSLTINKLLELEQAGFHIIRQQNGGPAKARNTGIEQAIGKYILPLDADNKIHPNYINKGIPLLESGFADIIYAKPEFFGDISQKRRQYKVRPFDDLAIVTGNCADACAIYKKEVWIKNNGYDVSIPHHGFEDWEFWIHAAANGFRFHLINEKLFYYRINDQSVITGYNNESRIVENHRYIAKKHSDFFLEKLVKLAYVRERYDIDILRFPLSPIIYLLYWLGIVERPVVRARKKLTAYAKLISPPSTTNTHMTPEQIKKVYINPTLKLGYGYYLIQQSLINAVSDLKTKILGNVLDVGCGVMPYKQFLLEQGNISKYTGMDLQYSEYHNKVVPDLFWDGQTIPLEDNSVDWIIATEFLEHYFDTQHILTEMKRVLKPGGGIFFSVPFIYTIHEIPHDHHRFTPFALAQHFENIGFSNHVINPRGGFNYSLLIMMSLWAKQAGSKGFIRLVVKFFMFCFHKTLIKNDHQISTYQKGFTKFENHTMPSGLWGYAYK